MGRSDIFLKLEIIKKIEGAIILLVTVWFGPFVMAASGLVTTWIGQMINAWPNKKLLNYSYKEQLFDFLPSLLLAGTMCVVVWGTGYLISCPLILKLLIQILIGIFFYIGGSIVFKIDSFYYVKEICMGFFIKRKK